MILTTLVSTWRAFHKISLRQMAVRTGLAYVTLHRLEKGRPISHKEWAKLWQWILSEEKP